MIRVKGRDLKRSVLLALSCTLLVFTGSAVLAQQTIFNVPSGDVLDKGKVYGRFLSLAREYGNVHTAFGRRNRTPY